MATENKTLLLYVGGQPKKLSSQALDILFRSIGLNNGTTTIEITNVADAFDFGGKSLANVNLVDGIDVSALATTVAGEPALRDSAISTAISTEVTNRNSAISSAISTEVTDRNSAISTAISSEVTARNSAISTAVASEATARDSAISTAISTEVTNRNSAIAAEATARDSAISTAISTEVTNRNSAIASEATARDSAIATAISTEVTNRNSAISTAVAGEATARDSAISTAIATEVTNRNSAIASEATARDSAIATAISTEVTDRNSAISSAISTEVTNRNSAISSAISTEVTDRDSAISTAVSTHVSATGAHAATKITYAATTVDAKLTSLSSDVSSAASAASAAQTTANLAETHAQTGISDAAAAQSTANAALPKLGGTMAGNIAMGGNKVTGLGVPTAASDAVTKAYVDANIAGLDFQADVKDYVTSDTFDPGATPTTGTRYILDSATYHSNFGTISGFGQGDIVQYSGSAWVVALDVSAHSTGGLVAWATDKNSFYNWSGSAWSTFGGLAGVTAGIGLVKTGNTIDVNLGAGITQLPTDEVGIDLATDSGLELTSALTGGQLQAKIDSNASLAKGSGGLKLGSGSAGSGMELEAAGGLSARKAFSKFTNDSAEIPAGALVYLKTNGKIAVCDADAIGTCEAFVGVAPAVIAADATGALVQVAGEATIIKTNSLVVGAPAFVSGTAGETCKFADVPSAVNSVEFKVGVATAVDKIVILPGLPIVNG